MFNALFLKSYLEISDLMSKYYGRGGNWGSQELFWEDIEELALSLKSD